MVLRPDFINEKNFYRLLPELTNEFNKGIYNYNFLLEVCKHINDNQEDILKPYIVDRFITENFEEAEWESRFEILEAAKKIYVDDVFKGDPDFKVFRISDIQDIMICIGSQYEKNETLVIPTELFKNTNLAPMEIVVYTLKQVWGKPYSVIAEMLGRNPRTIETTFKRAAFKLSKR